MIDEEKLTEWIEDALNDLDAELGEKQAAPLADKMHIVGQIRAFGEVLNYIEALKATNDT